MSDNYKRTFILPMDGHSTGKIITLIVISFLCILLLILSVVFIQNTKENRIMSGVYIDNINVSGLTKDEAKLVVEAKIKDEMPSSINLVHDDYEVSLDINQIHAGYDIDKTIEQACMFGKSDEILTNIKDIFSILLFHTNVELKFDYNEDELKVFLEDISTKLPDTVIQSSYYIEDGNLVLTKGKSGNIVDVEKTSEKIAAAIENRTYKDKPLEISIKTKEPDQLDIDKVYNEIHKDPVNAYYTTEPYVVYPHENGVDLGISLEEVKTMLNNEDKEEYVIPLKYTTPETTTNMIGTEAFPDLLSSFSTKYNSRDKDRTTNLVLSAGKINGTVLMPGETFSYNTIVGKRTIEAGYKNAAIYENGQVVDGLGGGICQISTTLYNAALYANLEITERRNHQFVPSYVNAGRDATVVYGTTDFKFKNNRSYPIKIICSVSGGIAKFEIYGLREETEYEVVLSSKIVSSTSTSLKSETYKTLKLNGEIISSETISKDTYKKH